MEALFIYLLKSSLCTALFFGIYRLFLKNETFYKFNRYFLFTGLLCAVILPFFQYSYLVTMEIPDGINPSLGKIPKIDSTVPNPVWINILFITYASVTCFFILRHIIGILKIKGMADQYGYSLFQGCKVVTTSVLNTSFSVFNYIFIHVSANTSETERKLILEHELAHIKQYHWIDLITVQLICALQWFNPFSWLYIHAIKENHEFLADKAVLKNGNSASVYRAALINHSLNTPVFMFASSFANYDRFKRINMMLKPNSSPVKKLVVLLTIPLLSLLLLAFAKPKYVITSVKKPKFIVPALPQVLVSESGISKTGGKKISDVKQGLSVKQAPSIALQKRSINTAGDTVTIGTHKPIAHTANDSVAVVNSNTSTPILVLDGIEQNVPIGSLSPNDIESITVLKGEKAIARFGARGANGAILVVSKSKSKY